MQPSCTLGPGAALRRLLLIMQGVATIQFHSHFSPTVCSTALKGAAQHIAGKGLGQRRRQPVTTVHVGYSDVCCINLYPLIYLQIHIAMYDAATCGGLI